MNLNINIERFQTKANQFLSLTNVKYPLYLEFELLIRILLCGLNHLLEIPF